MFESFCKKMGEAIRQHQKDKRSFNSNNPRDPISFKDLVYGHYSRLTESWFSGGNHIVEVWLIDVSGLKYTELEIAKNWFAEKYLTAV